MKRIIVGITGASGAIYGIRLLENLKSKTEVHLIITRRAKEVISLETENNIDDIFNSAAFVHDNNNLASSISSGSFQTEGMIVIPCSIKSLSAIAHSYSSSLLSRAADVTLKERRKLVLAVRETPLHIGHIKLMGEITEMGGIVFPLVPAFYNKPTTIKDLIDHTVGRILDIFKIEHSLFERWEGIDIRELDQE